MNRWFARAIRVVLSLAPWFLYLASVTPGIAQTASCGWMIRVHADNVSTVSGAEALAFDSITNSLLVKSLLDPSGTNVQLAEVASNGSFRVLQTYPFLGNSDFSGIAVDPVGGSVIVADEIGGARGRIARINRTTLAVSTLFDVPWIMNQGSNGTGQQQYAVDPATSNLLYFWDSTLSKVFRLNRSVNSLAELLALDQSTPPGQHIATFTNDVVVNPGTGTLLVSDGSSNRVLELDPGTSPPTVTTLFSGFSGRPTALALNPLTDFVFVVVGFNSVWAGPITGGPLSPIATGFSFLNDIVMDQPASGTLFAADKPTDKIYAITPLANAVQKLLADVNSADIPHGIRNALTAKLNAAIGAFDHGNRHTGVNMLEAFQHAVNAQSGKAIDSVTAANWVAAAQAIIDAAAACG